MPLLTKMTSIHFEDTNLNDEGFSLVLKCIYSAIPSFKSIKYKGSDNKYGEKSHEWF